MGTSGSCRLSASRWCSCWPSAAPGPGCSSTAPVPHTPAQPGRRARRAAHPDRFALVTPFWSLFDQKARPGCCSDEMLKPSCSSRRRCGAQPCAGDDPDPFNNLVLYRRSGASASADGPAAHGLRDRVFGPAWIAAGATSSRSTARRVSITWQSCLRAPDFGEVLVSATGLEFAYSQAPTTMKGAIMAFWNLFRHDRTCGCCWPRERAQRGRDLADSRARSERDSLPDVLLAAFALFVALSSASTPALPHAGPLPAGLTQAQQEKGPPRWPFSCPFTLGFSPPRSGD